MSDQILQNKLNEWTRRGFKTRIVRIQWLGRNSYQVWSSQKSKWMSIGTAYSY